MEFQICFSKKIAKYENDIFSLFEKPVGLFMFLHFQSPFSSFSSVKTGSNNAVFSLLLGLSPLWNRYSRSSRTTWATKRSVIGYDES